MNIYKTKYGVAKEKLKIYRKTIKNYSIDEILNGNDFLKSWNYLIAAYLTFWCTDEERNFIDLAFFRGYTVKYISNRLFISETACYAKKEKILDCLLGLALQERLVSVDLTNGRSYEEYACTADSLFDENEWGQIEKLIKNEVKRITPSLRLSVEAMIFITEANLPWRDLPKKYGSWKTVYNKFLRWNKSGLWDKICRILSK